MMIFFTLYCTPNANKSLSREEVRLMKRSMYIRILHREKTDVSMIISANRAKSVSFNIRWVQGFSDSDPNRNLNTFTRIF